MATSIRQRMGDQHGQPHDIRQIDAFKLLSLFFVLHQEMLIRQATLADAHAIASIHVDSWRSTYRGLVSDDYVDNLRLEDRLARWEQLLSFQQSGTFAYVAEDAPGQVVGFAYGGPERTGHPDYKGELWALHVAGPYQRAGLGRRLTSEVANRLHSMGLNSILIWVLTYNHPTRRFYERLGGVYVTERLEAFAGGSIDEVAYGWPNITTLIQAEP
jgi:ribosomal protein S18 acetylase RimI-like enzyme